MVSVASRQSGFGRHQIVEQFRALSVAVVMKTQNGTASSNLSFFAIEATGCVVSPVPNGYEDADWRVPISRRTGQGSLNTGKWQLLPAESHVMH